jgi:signal transduction histidine kinase
MKIKNKLTLIFTLIITLILLCLNLYIYFQSGSYAKNDFYDKLKDRAIITATIFLENDEENAATIRTFQKKFLHSLPKEIIRVYNKKDEPVFVDSTDIFAFRESIINAVRNSADGTYEYEDNGRQAVGILYKDNQGDFVVIASAVDEIGANNLDRLKRVLLLGFAASIIVVFFTGRYFTKLMLSPVASISGQAKLITETNLHLRLDEGNKKDELAKLSVIINRMLERLEYAFDLQKSFVSNASHELRTPLTSIIGNIDVALSRERTNEEYKTVLEDVMKEAEKLHELTNGLLKLAQSNIDTSHLKKENIRLDELLFELKDEMQVKRAGCEIQVEFTSMPEDPAEISLSGSKNLIEIALLNVLDNACKFSPGKKVMLSLFPAKDSISIEIADEGIGISAEELPHVMETFYRANNARSFTGTGIGLALTQKIIELYGGKISLSSEINNGTKVFISFPRGKT